MVLVLGNFTPIMSASVSTFIIVTTKPNDRSGMSRSDECTNESVEVERTQMANVTSHDLFTFRATELRIAAESLVVLESNGQNKNGA
jgi:hypothetical protein